MPPFITTCFGCNHREVGAAIFHPFLGNFNLPLFMTIQILWRVWNGGHPPFVSSVMCLASRLRTEVDSDWFLSGEGVCSLRFIWRFNDVCLNASVRFGCGIRFHFIEDFSFFCGGCSPLAIDLPLIMRMEMSVSNGEISILFELRVGFLS